MRTMISSIQRHREHCRETRAQMSDYLEGELDERAVTAVQRHLRWCPSCRRMLSSLNRTIASLRRLDDEPTPVDEPRPR